MVKSSIVVSVLVLLLVSSGFSLAQDAALSVDEMKFCTSVEERQPVSADTVFSNTIERVYCFTKISGADQATTVTHVWYFGDKEMARVDLNVKGSPWRTWSSKRIIPEWSGTWKVDVVSAAGEVLKSATFKIKSSAQ